jgi:hypothetical protein
VWGAFERYRGSEGRTGLFGDLSERSHLEELGIYKMKLLKLIFQEIKWGEEIDWTSLAKWSTNGLL